MRAHLPFFIVLGVVSFFLMAVGGFFLIMGLLEFSRGRASLEWPQTEGVVTRAEVVKSSRPDRNTQGRTRRRTEWIPHVTYRYRVDDIDYESSRVDFKTRSEGRDAALAELGELVVGARVQVFYSPSDPALAVLQPGRGPYDWIPPSVGIFGLLFPPAVIVFARHLVTRGAAPRSRRRVAEPRTSTIRADDSRPRDG